MQHRNMAAWQHGNGNIRIASHWSFPFVADVSPGQIMLQLKFKVEWRK